MKMNVELDCTPEEMRRLLGLPDVSEVNQAYVDSVKDMMKGATTLEQMQTLTKNIAPMGEMGMRFFQSLMQAGAAGMTGSSKSSSDKKKD
ncbi:DUF6489 family protein [Alterisphingorhabdus coralli]|uniref:DUF6489 family protein n=1 Tax=Alterisphingorhabdus coralli TaxID=3071408 RepID=A0AA97F6S3_9SPHN|nr:DUF6489 family protein [Parasphingorhabdus sp. SCSIO 66989]WOE75449.1 DUF6489 family protein [Parasphingorhabdus sp. SCSIO 66989]